MYQLLIYQCIYLIIDIQIHPMYLLIRCTLLDVPPYLVQVLTICVCIHVCKLIVCYQGNASFKNNLDYQRKFIIIT